MDLLEPLQIGYVPKKFIDFVFLYINDAILNI